MASLLRSLVAGPRSRHPDANLDLCYVTSQIIATSGPSGTYPQRAYRNPLDQLVKFLDKKHGSNWAIWEFRAEGTGYPDEEVYGRIWHYPWPDHHPPPFRLVPMIMASMRNWLREGEEETEKGETKTEKNEKNEKKGNGRVVVVHCKAGKGRSGSAACSYLISECGWKASDALARFTERRMRPGFGQGVSIPSQLRYVGYVDRWTRGGKVYVDRQIEIVEVHVWGLRDGVKVQIEGYVDEGKKIKVFHRFNKSERQIVEGNAPGSKGITDMFYDMAGFQNNAKPQAERSKSSDQLAVLNDTSPRPAVSRGMTTTAPPPDYDEAGGSAVIFKPAEPIILPTSDINLDFERRNKASMGWTMVTSVAHVWFNPYFEGNGPENNGVASDSGVFEIDWDKMDGIKGSSRKGTRALDRLAVLWRAHNPKPGSGRKDDVIHEPSSGSPVPQMRPADWKGEDQAHLEPGKDLGLRTESPASANVSKASSIKSEKARDEDEESVKGVKSSGPDGNEDIDKDGDVDIDMEDLPKPENKGSVPSLEAVNHGLDTASGTTVGRDTELKH